MENLNISEKEIHVYFILSRSAQDEEEGEDGCRTRDTRDSPSKGSSTGRPMRFNVASPPPGNAGNSSKISPVEAGPFGEISIPIIL